MQSYQTFTTAQAATGLVDKTSYWVAGNTVIGDTGAGWFVFASGSSATGSNDVIVITAGGRLLRVTTDQGVYATQAAVAIGSNLRAGAAIPVSGTVTANAGTGTQAVSLASLPALVTSAAAIGKLAANAGVTIGAVEIAAAQTLATVTNIATIGTSVTPGTGAAHLGKAEDSIHTTGDVGVMPLAVRNDAGTSLVDASGDYSPLSLDGTGALRVTGIITGVTQYNEDAPHISGDLGTMPLAVRKDTAAAIATTDGDYTPLQTDANGALRVVGGTASTQYAEDTAHTTGHIGTMTLAVRKDVISSLASPDGDYTSLQTDANGALRVSGTGGGEVVHDAVGTGTMPLLVGGYASAAAPAGVSADGDAVRGWRLLNGAAATVLTAAGALIPGDATNGLDVDVTRLPALVAGSALIGKVNARPGGTEYETVAASATTQALGATGATGDYLEGLVCVVSTAATSQVQIKDGANTAIMVLPNAVSGGIGTYQVALGLISTAGAWQITTAAGVAVIASGDFT